MKRIALALHQGHSVATLGQVERNAEKGRDTPDPYQETGHNAIFEGPDGQLWSSCHYFFDQRTPLADWQKVPQLGIEPLRFRNGIFAIDGPTSTEQTVRY